MNRQGTVPSVQGMRMPLVGADLAERINHVAERRRAIYPNAEVRAGLDQLEALSADLVDRLCRRIEALGPLAQTEDVFAYFRLRLDAVKLITFLGQEDRILTVAAEDRKRYAPFWRQLQSWPSPGRDGRGRAEIAKAKTALLRALHSLASARGAISKAALIANLELCRHLLKAHHGVMQTGMVTVGANDMSRFRAPAYESVFQLACLAFGMPLLAFEPKERPRGIALDGFDLRSKLGEHLIQFMLTDALPSRYVQEVRCSLGQRAAREFAALSLLRSSRYLASEEQISELFRKHAAALRRARLTALLCQE